MKEDPDYCPLTAEETEALGGQGPVQESAAGKWTEGLMRAAGPQSLIS